MYLLAPDEPHKGETGPCRAINMFYTLIVKNIVHCTSPINKHAQTIYNTAQAL